MWDALTELYQSDNHGPQQEDGSQGETQGYYDVQIRFSGYLSHQDHTDT